MGCIVNLPTSEGGLLMTTGFRVGEELQGGFRQLRAVSRRMDEDTSVPGKTVTTIGAGKFRDREIRVI